MRARLTQEFFGYLDEYEQGLQDGVRSRVSPAYLATVLDSPPMAWIPLALADEGVSAAIERLGRDRAPLLWRRLAAENLIRTPILRGMFNAWVRLAGLDPGSLFKMLPRALEGSYREVGNLSTYQHARGHSTIELGDAAPELFENLNYLVCFEGAFASIFDICNTTGTLELRRDATRRHVVFDCRW